MKKYAVLVIGALIFASSFVVKRIDDSNPTLRDRIVAQKKLEEQIAEKQVALSKTRLFLEIQTLQQDANRLLRQNNSPMSLGGRWFSLTILGFILMMGWSAWFTSPSEISRRKRKRTYESGRK